MHKNNIKQNTKHKTQKKATEIDKESKAVLQRRKHSPDVSPAALLSGFAHQITVTLKVKKVDHCSTVPGLQLTVRFFPP
jgi:hypothetical protein